MDAADFDPKTFFMMHGKCNQFDSLKKYYLIVEIHLFRS